MCNTMCQGYSENIFRLLAYCLLSILIPGLVGNLISLTVWVASTVTSNQGAPVGWYESNTRLFAVLCCSDALAIVMYIVAYSWIIHVHPGNPCESCLFFYVGDCCSFFSDYVIVIICVQRLVAVLKPFSLAKLFSTRRQWTAVCVCFVINLMLSSFFANLKYDDYRSCVDSDSPHIARGGNMTLFKRTILYGYTTFSFLQLLLLLVVNTLLLKSLWTLRRRSHKQKDIRNSRRATQATWQTTKMIIAVSTPTILKYAMLETVNIDLTLQNFNPALQNIALKVCCQVAAAFSVSVNVVFYSFYGDRFRTEVKKMKKKLKRKLGCMVHQGEIAWHSEAEFESEVELREYRQQQ